MKKILFITLAAIWMISATSSTAKLHSRTEKANVADTVAILAEKAEKGDAVAQNTFGLWYYTGKNVKQDSVPPLHGGAKAQSNRTLTP